WQLSGIPCNHAVAAIWSNAGRPEHYVSEYFTKQFYLKAYDFVMKPLNGSQEWKVCNKVLILPPHVRKVKNKPTHKRKKQIGEVLASGKLKKCGGILRCSTCWNEGHNKRKCIMLQQPSCQSAQSQNTHTRINQGR
ncbi:Dual serine/threonine and tyrosine protein kinase, partial [Bienertia sinuspersici]